ncbi:hypothetical protein [Methylobacterium sp. Leaf88]|uniref:hypothetical protein n=1 Tax=Methylobacterium sp. Leaf88 TaxID=1736244 RepID=UPI0006FFB680|nr:hypothetical protein [Methylobacterium sp. Leaf88]KQO61816.1 hypothetical protein ASF20_10140 [Methylobacterium sp. Leaf88]
MSQLSMMPAIDAALTTGFPCGSWWWPAWKAGDPLPPGWRPPVPGADNPKPRLPAGSPPGIACDGDEIDVEIAKALDTWVPDGLESPFIGIHQTRRLACGGAWACLEALDGGLSHATVRHGVIEWGHVPGAGALVAWEGTTEWARLPAGEAWDEEAQAWGPHLHWSLTWKPGDVVPPGYTPPIAGEALPGWQASHGGTLNENIVSDVWAALWASHPPGVPFPLEGFVETHVFPDGALWASMVAITDGGLCHVTLRDGQIEWSEAPGAGMLVWREDTSTWGRLPAKDAWDAEAQAWVPKASSIEAVSAPPDVEAIETSASASSDVDPKPVAPVALPLPSGGIEAFLHAHNLATNAGWEALANSLSRTTPGDVRNAVARNVAGGSLAAVNAEALLARLDAAEPPAEVVTEAEFPDVDPVHGTRRAPPPPPDFMEELVRKQDEARARREEAWRPMKALVNAGLAKMGQLNETRVRLLPPASDGLMLWYDPSVGDPKEVSLWITDPNVDPDILTRIEGILGVTARGAATSIRLLKADPP